MIHLNFCRMTDYYQPDFYRFNEDSLMLVKKIISHNLKPRNILDIGAGSGIIGMELALKLTIPMAHFLELQTEWKSFVEKNADEFLRGIETRFIWSSVGNWSPDMKYDLIVSNPPYYLPEKNRVSPDPVRARCRSFMEDDWNILFRKSASALAPGGKAFFVTARSNLSHVRKEGSHLSLEIFEMDQIVIVSFSSPG